jgi:uncharacterized protein YndB with AHSA1/START domain
MGDRERGFVHRADILAPAGEVWRALTEARELRQWCAPDADIQARRGGLFRASVDRLTQFEARIEICTAPQRLRLMYLPAPLLPPADTVMVDDFILEGVPRGTIVRLLVSGISASPQWDPQYRRLRASWLAALQRLKVFVEQHQPKGEGATP